MDYKDVKVTMFGEEIEVKPFTYNEGKHIGMEYYHRRGNRYYFRNKMGKTLIMTSNEDLYKHLKYGQVIDLDID